MIKDGEPGGNLPPGTLNQVLYFNGSAWTATSELSVDPVGQVVSIANTWLAGGGEFLGSVGVHGASAADKLSVLKVGPGAKVFGVDTNTARVHLLGSQIWKRTAVTVSPHNVSGEDFILSVNTNVAITINLPAANAVIARPIAIKDAAGAGAAVNNITITPAGADTIDQVAGALVIVATRSVTWLMCDGTSNWEIL
jgi:hypothetical protein